MALGPFAQSAPDLAPGDMRALDGDWSELTLDSVGSADATSFDAAYARLWREFGERGEMERRDVIADRLRWRPRKLIDGYALLYEMLVVRRGAEMAAVRDHTAIVPSDASGEVVVHLSHALVAPAFRGSGLAAWLRALPIATARECAAAAGRPACGSVTLVAEMEHDDHASAAVATRLRSYGRAGFRMVDPRRVRYRQPDFRSVAEIERSSLRPLPLGLMVRRVGREHETSASGAALRRIIEALYAMFGVHVRADHMAPLQAMLKELPDGSEQIALLSPRAAERQSK